MADSFRQAIFRQTMKVFLCLMVLAAGIAQGQTGSVSLNGSGTLHYNVIHQGPTPCNPNSHTFLPDFQTWTFNQFVYTDGSGVSHSLSGSAGFLQSSGGAGCPQSGASPTVLNGSDFSINVQPGAGNLSAALNVFLFPKFYILSILYDAPGNQSSNSFGNKTSAAATTEISKTFQNAIATTATVSAPGGSSVGATWSVAKATGDSQSFTVSTSQGGGSSSTSVKNPVDHGQDEFFLLLNPMIIVTPTGSSAGTYIVTTPPRPNGQPEPMDIVRINVADLQNPSQIPIGTLGPQTRVDTSGVAVSGMPGLANICANLVPACTTAPCGCVANDFATILKQDPLINSGQTTAPNQIDGERFVFVNSQTLQGPLCAGCNLNGNSFEENDDTISSTTQTTTRSYSVGYTTSAGFTLFGAGFQLQQSNSFTWTDSMSSGTSNGASHTAEVNLQTSSVGCDETVDVYEDTVYHTFAFSLPVTPPAACN